jgi:hypothetical protein
MTQTVEYDLIEFREDLLGRLDTPTETLKRVLNARLREGWRLNNHRRSRRRRRLDRDLRARRGLDARPRAVVGGLKRREPAERAVSAEAIVGVERGG